MSAPVSAVTRARWRKQRDFIVEFGSRYLNERERQLVAEVTLHIESGRDLAFADSVALSRLHAQLQERIG